MAVNQYIQLVTPNYNIPYVGGLCEGFVEGTVGQATLPTPSNPVTYGVYPTAIAAWNASKDNHPNELPPLGLRVALYFTLGSNKAGHTAIQLEDGRVASSTQSGWHPTAYIHHNLQNLINTYAKANGSCTYLGWSEWIGKLRIIQGDQDMIQDTDEEYNRWALTSKYTRSRVNGDNQLVPLSREEFQRSAVGKSWLTALEILEDGKEAKDTLVTLQTGEDAQHGDWVGQIKSLQSVIKEKDAEIEQLKKKDGEFTKVLNAGTDLYIKEK